MLFRRPLTVALAATVVLGGLAAPAAAVLSGENGRIVFASGRDGEPGQGHALRAIVRDLALRRQRLGRLRRLAWVRELDALVL
jgi:hypothetical protein